MKTFKQFMEGGFVKRVGEPISMQDMIKGLKIIDDTETCLLYTSPSPRDS